MAKFKEAFAAAKKSGKKTFTWNGKKYNTKTKDDVESENKRVASKARPQVSPKKREKGGASGELSAISESKAMSRTKKTSSVKPDRSKRTSPYNTARAKAGQRYVNKDKKKITRIGKR